MTDSKLMWNSVLIKFQTPAIMPPPYSYFYTLQLLPKGDAVEVELTLQYLDRDELDEESILDEGFTLDDDYSWKGTLPAVWHKELNRLLDPGLLSRKQSITDNENYLEIIVNRNTGDSVSYFPNDPDSWDYFQHELLQAIYEASGKESPFMATYLEIDGKNKLKMDILASFESRKLSVQINGANPKVLPWTRTQEIMETIFRADFLEEYALEKEPSQKGTYLNIGDGLWYEFGESLVESTSKTKFLPQIIRLFDRLREEVVR